MDAAEDRIILSGNKSVDQKLIHTLVGADRSLTRLQLSKWHRPKRAFPSTNLPEPGPQSHAGGHRKFNLGSPVDTGDGKEGDAVGCYCIKTKFVFDLYMLQRAIAVPLRR